MWMVTAGHEQMGAVEVYAQDVSWTSFKWLKGLTLVILTQLHNGDRHIISKYYSQLFDHRRLVAASQCLDLTTDSLGADQFNPRP